jgi:hypothetical protein
MGFGRFKKLWIWNKICSKLPAWVMEVTTLLQVYAGKFPLICRKLSEKCNIYDVVMGEIPYIRWEKIPSDK